MKTQSVGDSTSQTYQGGREMPKLHCETANMFILRKKFIISITIDQFTYTVYIVLTETLLYALYVYGDTQR